MADDYATGEKRWWDSKTLACIAGAIIIIVADKLGVSEYGMLGLSAVVSILLGTKVYAQGQIDKKRAIGSPE